MNLQIERLDRKDILELVNEVSDGEFHPLHFIKSLNFKSIYTSLLESLSNQINRKESVCMRITDGSSRLTILSEYLPWDSDHFGFSISKISFLSLTAKTNHFASTALRHFIDEISKVGINYITCSLDLRKICEIQALANSLFTPIEHRAHYHIDLKDFSYPKRFKVRLATEKDIESLSETAANNQNPYDRFFGDPVLNRSSIEEMMRIWLIKSITSNFASGALVPDIENPKAFCTFKTHQANWDKWGVKLSQPILAAVSPEASGWYLKIMSELSYYLKEIGADKIYMTTQLANLAVIRSWEALGYRYGGSEIVMRWSNITNP